MKVVFHKLVALTILSVHDKRDIRIILKNSRTSILKLTAMLNEEHGITVYTRNYDG